nr:hypothetical protein [Tanacetum cinerariifolium]
AYGPVVHELYAHE